MANAVIITDLDNTLYNWVDYFAPSFRAMVHVLSRELRLAESVIYEAFREVYSNHSSLEYAFSVQELSVCQELPRKEVERLAKVAKGAFSRVREKNLRPYPGVVQTLEWALRNGVIVVAATNAPVKNAQGRLRQLKIDGYFSALAGLYSFDPPEDGLELTKKIADRDKVGGYRTKIPEHRVCGLKRDELKPSPAGYQRILKDLSLRESTVYVIGDSIEKDLAPARELGLETVWARYGTIFDSKNFETLLRITHWSTERIEATYSRSDIVPDYEISSFSELRDFVDPPQLSLFPRKPGETG